VVLAVLGFGNFMAALDLFIVNVAIPSIHEQLHASTAAVEAVVTAYALTYAVLLITGGRLGDLWGYKRVFMGGMALFIAASLLCGIAPSPGALVAGRVLQAIGAAGMLPQVFSTMQRVFTPRERILCVALLTSTSSLAVICGQVLGGALIQADILGLGWRVVFLINLPVGVVALTMSALVLGEGRGPRRGPLDLSGVLLVAVALLLLTGPLVEGRDAGWPWWIVLLLVLSPLAFAVFVAHERRVAAMGRDPLVDLGLFRERSFSVGMGIAALNHIGNAGLFFVLAIFLQSGRGFSPESAGLVFAPIGIGYVAGAVVATRVFRRVGRSLISIGYATIATGAALTLIRIDTAGASLDVMQLVPCVTVIGIGQGFVNSPLYSTVLSRVGRGREGSASGLLTTVQQAGSAVGVAVLGLVYFSVLGAAGGLLWQRANDAITGAMLLNVVIGIVASLAVRVLPRDAANFSRVPRAGQPELSDAVAAGAVETLP
jgi:EmrB/QacA subfamily drug resistance transporter